MQTVGNLLSDDHAELDGLLKDVFTALNAGDNAAAFEKLDLFWARLAMHIRAEHLHLFPAILEHCQHKLSISSDIRDKIKLLRHDHDFFMREVAQTVKSMREISEENAARTRIEIRARLRDIEKRLNEHNRMEEMEVYPLMQELTACRESK